MEDLGRIYNSLAKISMRLESLERMVRNLPVKSNENLGDWLTEEQARELLQRGATSLWDLRKRKKLETSRIGNRIYYSKNSILNFLDQSRVK